MRIDFFKKQAQSDDSSSSLDDVLCSPNTYMGYETKSISVDKEFT